METVFTSSSASPDIMLIGGREHVLYHGLFEPLKIVDRRFLWVYSVLVWMVALLTVLFVLTLDKAGPWAILSIIGTAAAAMAVGGWVDRHSGVTTPVAIKEKDRSDTWSRLVVNTRHHDPLTVTAHVDMADFLQATMAEGHTGRFLNRPTIPAELRHAGIQRHVWIVAAGMAIGGPAYAVLLFAAIAALV